MKGSFKNLFVIIMILISLIGSSTQVRSVDALAYPGTNTPVSLPASWQTAKLIDVWGYDASNVYIAGYGASSGATLPVIYKKNGTAWDPSTPSLPTGPGSWSSGHLRAVWGATASDVYAVGDGTSTISGISYTLPLIYKKGATTWSPTSPDLPGEISAGGWISGQLEDAWGSSANDVFVVGYGNTSGAPTKPIIYRSTDYGANWTYSLPPLPVNWNGFLYGVWGSDYNDIYVAGYGNDGTTTVPLIYHTSNGGANWTQASLSLPMGWSNGSLYSIWGSAANDIYVVGSGNNGTDTVPLVYHYNGSNWALSDPLPLKPSDWGTTTLTGVWGSGGIVYAVGYGDNADTIMPLIYRKTSSGWAASIPAMNGWNHRYLESMWGSDAYNMYFVGYGDTPTDINQPLLYSVGPDTTAPGAVTSLNANPGKCAGSVNLNWTAPADDASDPNSGPVDSYLVRYSSNPITNETEWNAATPVNGGLPTPVSYGNAQTMKISGLTPGAQYYFAVRARDEELNTSTIVSVSGTAASVSSAASWYIYGVGLYSYGAACDDIPVAADYNGDGKAEIAVFRPSNSTWYIRGIGSFVYGTVGDIPVVADYNGDGKADIAVFRPSNSTWYIRGIGSFVYGTVGDIPVVADYNGDRKADIAVFRPSNSTWYVRGVGSFVYGTVGDIPVVADYNGDKKADIAVFRPSNSTWYIRGIGSFVYGTVGDIPVVADYNGDGKADIAVFRPSNSTWYIRGIGSFVYGTVGDIPVVADYTGDKKADIAVFRY